MFLLQTFGFVLTLSLSLSFYVERVADIYNNVNTYTV